MQSLGSVPLYVQFSGGVEEDHKHPDRPPGLEGRSGKGLNISRICEQALKQAVQQKGGGGTVGSPLEPRAGFEPATLALPRRCPNPARPPRHTKYSDQNIII